MAKTETEAQHPHCLNCGAELGGQYCGRCGQRASNRLISLWELVRDAFGDLFELDSRLWRTLIPLLTKPGALSRDYLEGRRARYMPPFRMYLVLSVIFFVVAFFDPRDDLGLLFEPEPPPTPEQSAAADAQVAAAEEELEAAREQIQRELDEEGLPGTEALKAVDNHVKLQLAPTDGREGVKMRFDKESGECEIEEAELENLPRWLQRRLTVERIEGICTRISADGAKTFTGLLLDNIPIALIVLLPVMALVLKGLYPLSRRYFVEHLLFFVHFHSFFFLILTLQILFARTAGLVQVPNVISTLILVAASLYIPVYLYKAMRSVYGQGPVITFGKYLALSVAYAVGASLTVLGALLFALVSV